jgi:hypothetical protein
MPRAMPVKRAVLPPLKEREVVQQVKDFLQWRGWRAVRMQRTVIAGAFQAGEPGMPDYLFLHYLGGHEGSAIALWIEFKRPGGPLRAGQQEWHARELVRGGVVWVVEQLDDFMTLYNSHFGYLHPKRK